MMEKVIELIDEVISGVNARRLHPIRVGQDEARVKIDNQFSIETGKENSRTIRNLSIDVLKLYLGDEIKVIRSDDYFEFDLGTSIFNLRNCLLRKIIEEEEKVIVNEYINPMLSTLNGTRNN